MKTLQFCAGAALALGVLLPASVASAANINFSGTLDSSVPPTQNNRITRNGVISSCAAPKGYPGPQAVGTPIAYRTTTYVNTTAAAQCVNITTTVGDPAKTTATFTSAYLGTYDPTNFATNYLGDAGFSGGTGTFSVTVPAGQTLVVVVNEVNTGQTPTAFTVTAPDPVPTLTEWALGGLALILAGVGGVALMRRRSFRT